MATAANNTPSGVIATGLPTRRRAFATLAGLGAALSLPGVAQAVAGAEHPDAALLAMPPRIAAVQAALDAACDRLRDADLLKYAGKPSPDKEGAEAEEEAACSAWAALRDEIVDMPATTLDGLRVKAAFCPQPWGEPDLMLSIVADILNMTGGDA